MVQPAQMSKENYITKAGIKNLQQMQVYVTYATSPHQQKKNNSILIVLQQQEKLDYLIIQVCRQITFTQ